MATIELSAGWVSAMMPRLFRLTDAVITSVPPPSNAGGAGLLAQSGGVSSGYSIGQILLMKGAVPTSSTLFTVSSRSSDILVRFTNGTSGGSADFNPSQVTVNPAIISTAYSAATGSGTATWFLWVSQQTNSSANGGNGVTGAVDTALPYHQIIGTVGLTGSGADLEMVSTAITAGETYRIMNLRLQFPTSWTY